MRQLPARRMARVVLGLAVLAALAFGLHRLFLFLGRDPQAGRFEFHLLFQDVQGLRRGSRLVCRGMTLGEVADLSLDPGAGLVRVLCRVDREARELVRTTTRAWVVRPRLALDRRGVSGLDTLVKESYLRLLPPAGGEPLARGQELMGLPGPPGDVAGDLPPRRPGDLEARVLLPHAEGLHPGTAVACRGVAVGDVRRVELTGDGRGVLVNFTVERIYRETVREGSRFWVDRPWISGGVIGGISLAALGRLREPALVYDTPAPADSGPAPDHTLFRGLAAPPGEESWEPGELTPEPVARRAREQTPRRRPLSPWVEVTYRALERDTFSGDDPVAAVGPGILYRHPDGPLLCLTARSACDASILVAAHWYDRLRIDEERIRVKLADGRILPARRLWLHDREDLALLRLDLAGVTLPPWRDYLRFADPPGGKGEPLPAGPAATLLKKDGRAWGLAGSAGPERRQRRRVSFALVPPRLRPRSE